jgi:glycosyl transferase, family 25
MGGESGQFDALFDCFVISLERTPERLKAFYQFNSKSAVNFQHFIAIEGEATSYGGDAREILAPAAVPYTPSALGCALSHLKLWRRCADQTKNFIVCEDDAVVRRDAKARLPALLEGVDGWDIIMLGYNTDIPLELNITPDISCGARFSVPYPNLDQLSAFARSTNPVGLHRLTLALGTCGYALSPNGARSLIQACFPLDNRLVRYSSINYSFRAAGIDAIMATVYPTISAFACLAPLVMTTNNRAASTVKSLLPRFRRWDGALLPPY